MHAAMSEIRRAVIPNPDPKINSIRQIRLKQNQDVMMGVLSEGKRKRETR